MVTVRDELDRRFNEAAAAYKAACYRQGLQEGRLSNQKEIDGLMLAAQTLGLRPSEIISDMRAARTICDLRRAKEGAASGELRKREVDAHRAKTQFQDQTSDLVNALFESDPEVAELSKRLEKCGRESLPTGGKFENDFDRRLGKYDAVGDQADALRASRQPRQDELDRVCAEIKQSIKDAENPDERIAELLAVHVYLN